MTKPGMLLVSDIIKNAKDKDKGESVEVPFTQNENTYLTRKDGNIIEVMPSKQFLKINSDGSKTKYSHDRKEVCYNNQKG